MADRKKILVLEGEKLLAASIASLLASHPELEVMNTPEATLAGWNKSGGVQPDVVILDEELLAINLSDIVRLANCHPSLRLIVYGLNDGRVQIFDKQVVQVRHFSDFLRLL